MEAEALVPSKAASIRRGTRVLALPVEQDGEAINVKFRALPKLEVFSILEGVPGVVADASEGITTIAQARELFVKSEASVARLIEAAVIEPQFYFGEPIEGRAAWVDLLPDNQAALTKGIMEFSGMKGDPAPEVAAFRAGGEGK